MSKKWKVPFVNGKFVSWTKPAKELVGSFHSDEFNERAGKGVRYVLPGDGEQSIIPESEVEWKENYEFHATLTIVELERGRSAAHYVVQDEQGMKYIFFVADLLRTLQSVGCQRNAKIEADWTFCKRGQNYGVRLAEKGEE